MEHYWGCEKELPCAPGTSPYRIKGEFYRNVCETIAFVEKKAGPKLRQAFEAQGVRAFLEQDFLANQSYDLLPLPRATMAMAHALGKELRYFTTRMGENGIKLQLNGVYKSIFAGMNPDNFAQRFNKVVGYLYDHGPVSIERDGNHATIVRRGVPACTVEWWSLVSIPYLTVPLEHNGARNVKVDYAIKKAGLTAQIPLADTEWKMSWDE
jgi:hypothetical protein